MKMMIYEMTCYSCGVLRDSVDRNDDVCPNCGKDMEVDKIVESDCMGRIRFIAKCDFCKHGIRETQKCYLGGIDVCKGKLFEKR